ncbi:Endo-beta-1,6-galactanase [Phytophthora cactorum]|nr:Endo-beta-1,6-galactanase [Phytophthora cactorum]
MVEGVELTDGVVRSFSVARNFAPQEDEDPNVQITSLDFHRNGERCVTSRSDGVVSMINCLSGTVAKTILTKRYGVGIVRFTHHLDCVIFSSANIANDHRIRYHSFFDNKFLRYYTGHTDRVTSLMMHPTADQFLSAGMDGTIRLWDIRNFDTTAIIRTDHLPVSHVCAAYDQEGVVFAVYTDDHLIRMYDARNYQEGPFAKFSLYDASIMAAVEPFLAHMQAPNLSAKKLHALDLKFSPDGNQLLVTTNRGVFIHLDAFEGKLLHLFKEHGLTQSQRGDPQLGCCYSADGAYVVTGAEDGRVFFYKSSSGHECWKQLHRVMVRDWDLSTKPLWMITIPGRWPTEPQWLVPSAGTQYCTSKASTVEVKVVVLFNQTKIRIKMGPRTDASYPVTHGFGFEKWEGWGTSLCWWANAFGDREDIADVFFTRKESVKLDGATSGIPALGFNIARYNIGGSSKNVIDNGGTEIAMKQSENMPPFKFIESFWLNWASNDSTSKSWDWDADVKQRTMLDLAIKRGVDVTEAFSNAPPWWMTHNHATAGGDDGKKDNLQSWNHDAFALYLATVVKQAKDSWGVNFTYVEPFNEPMSTWWTYPGKQEGCHFEVKTQNDVLLQLRGYLDKFGMKDVIIATSDENTPSIALSTLTSMSENPDVMATFGKVNTHGYEGLSPYRGKNREPLKSLITKSKKALWDSEYGEKDGTGLSMAESIALDINQMGVSAFVYWQVLDGGGWGLIQSSLADKTISAPNTKYYALAQYSRHIRPGMAILSTDDVNTVMAYDAKSKLLILATVNTGDAASKVTYDLASFKSVAGPVSAWTTETSGTGALYKSLKVELTSTTFSASIPAASVMTFEIEGVV